jgi:hypothetical protein
MDQKRDKYNLVTLHFRNVVTRVWCKNEDFPAVRINSGLLGYGNHVVWQMGKMSPSLG